MNIRDSITLAKEMISRYEELKNWTVTINNRKTAFGICDYNKKQIQLSILLIPEMTEDAIKDTIIHEIAHALTKGNGHNYIWKRKCIELGGNGKRCGGSEKYKDGEKGKSMFQEKTAKYTLTCPTCNNKSYMNRQPKRNKSCGLHGSRFYQEEHKLIITKNY